ncbi:MAG: class III poly(R)-hydroxyalkanoic acid synthase subunit PhaC [Pseudomonadota bacterium]
MRIFNDKKTAESLKEYDKLQEKFFKGLENMMGVKEVESATTPKEEVFARDRMKLYHYLPVKEKQEDMVKTPLLIVYALVNRQYMMDLQSDRSLIKNLLNEGVDVYVVDWGYARPMDRYITLEDYIEGYMNDCIELVCRKHNIKKINLMGVCQGGTFSIIYAALNPKKIRNLVAMVAPVDFHTEDGLLNIWSKSMDPDKMVDTLGNIPGDFMNLGFLMLKPFQLILDKYVGLMENMDKKPVVENFLRMEKWIFDSPDQVGEAFRKFINDMYKDNKLIKGEFELGGRTVDLKKITMPVLNIYAEQDHLVPPSCSIPLNDHIGSKDKHLLSFPVGHIGMYVSGKSQKKLGPNIAQFIRDRDSAR